MIRIGSRGSELALWQANHVKSLLNVPCEIVVIKTKGDRIQDLSLDKVEGKGFFTKEIETALLNQEVDLAVHSYKDLPTEAVPGLKIAAVPTRAPARDIFVLNRRHASSGGPIPVASGARVGTSSLRRKAALNTLGIDIRIVDLRGNVPTRLRKVQTEEFDAVVLAEAGLRRLGLYGADPALEFIPLSVESMCPAPAQGALAIQVREGDVGTSTSVARLHDRNTAVCVETERTLLSRFGGGCHLPLGAYCEARGDSYCMRALVASADGTERLWSSATNSDPAHVADSVHRKLLEQGVERLI